MLNLNESIIENEDIETIIEEMSERQELHCTGNVCGADACGAHDISLQLVGGCIDQEEIWKF